MSPSDIPYHEQAARLAQEGKVSEALECYDRALRSSPDNDVILNNKAIALISMCRFEEAYTTAKRAAAVNPASVDGWINMGVALERLDRLPEASDALERAVSIDPYHAYARAMLGMIYQKMNMEDRAEAQNRKLQEIVFPSGFAGLYFATAAFLLGILLGGIRSVEGKPAEITVPSEFIIVLFFLVICGLYWRSLKMGQELNRNVIIIPCQPTVRPEHHTNSHYFILAAMAIVFIVGILLGHDVWNWLH
jgi:tetratricopeptide (TPR) repeat protein